MILCIGLVNELSWQHSYVDRSMKGRKDRMLRVRKCILLQCVATLGSTSTCAFDKLLEIGPVCECISFNFFHIFNVNKTFQFVAGCK